MFSATSATTKILGTTKRLRCIPGGTSASKTISILLYLIDKAQSDKKPTLTSIVSESIPHLKKGCIRDFKNILKEHKYWRDSEWMATDFTYTFRNGSQIEFFGADQAEKLRGGRRDRLFINEANNVSFAAFEELEVRTREFVFLDWNPTNEFWYYTEVKGKRDDVEELTLTYLDNEALDEETKKSIEQRKNRKNWWLVYGLGQLGELEELIYKNWQIIDEIPHEARLERRGLDFGYTNDPSVLEDLYKWNNAIIIDEQLYQKGLSNREIADFILSLQNPHILVKADSAEPKSIDEIKSYGVNIVPALKGQGSVNQGIQYCQDQKFFITKRSINTIKDFRNYSWKTDNDGKILNTPDHLFSHSPDAVRYGLSEYSQPLLERPQYNIQRQFSR